ncbi:MAG: citrate lyase subunit beta [Lawsonibacter sp.]|jgi:citrate lyase subunit beta/citryl-CoA lyase|uniref:HpcH/HpaI aldolase/citrate lyase family protein n=1 Tax=Lawsonibacter sp. JLR.KK007 TaxID=3114293 RepID=UPI00217084C0|nr:citrate lyase subunit beta [Lawsonibacter sp.]MCI8990211.1 citrate lyase subunit beta [Lawsonibacter sp.]MCI9268067.1 citrate lyase subunit beta [Lawsonibacter sp.]
MNRDRLRRTGLYASASNPSNMTLAPFYRADFLVYDLEDSVSVAEKDSARFLVFNTLHRPRLTDVELVVRINGLDTPFGLQDLEAIVRAKPDLIRVPKCESPANVQAVCDAISRIERDAGIPEGSTGIMASIETAAGVLNARDIAASSPRLVAIGLGGEDFTASMKTTRTREGSELFYARSAIALAARAAGIQALDTIFADVNDEEGLIADTMAIKTLGYDGKLAIHPRQVDVINGIFTPTDQEIRKAVRIFEAIQEANAHHSGVIALDGKMIDLPVVERAERTLALARATGKWDGGED